MLLGNIILIDTQSFRNYFINKFILIDFFWDNHFINIYYENVIFR